MLKMERAECERLLNLHGKQRQYIVRESKKVLFSMLIFSATCVFIVLRVISVKLFRKMLKIE